MKEWNEKERWNLAATLEGILGADLDADEEDAIRDAIRIVSPEFAAMRDEDEAAVVDWFENTPPDEQKRFVEDELRKSESGVTVNGKIVRFGQEKKQ